MAKRSRSAICAAVRRLKGEELMNLYALADEIDVSVQTLTRWAIEGKQRCWLDAVHRPGVGWLSSREACERFLMATEVKAELSELCGSAR